MHKCAEMPYHIGVAVRLYPSYRQKRVVAKNDGAQRYVYNKLVATDKELFLLKKTGTYLEPVADRIDYLESVSATASAICNSAPFLYDKEIDSQCIANGIQNYRKAWKNFRDTPGTSVPVFHDN